MYIYKRCFFGDSTCDGFFTGIKRAELCEKLSDTIKRIHPEICIEGHWVPVDMQNTLNELMSENLIIDETVVCEVDIL